MLDLMKQATKRDYDRLGALQAGSVGYALIMVARLWNETAIARVNLEAGRPMLREAHTRLLPYLSTTGVRVTALAEQLGISKQAVSKLVSELAAERIVVVRPDPSDGRALQVSLTRFGLTAMLHGTSVLRAVEHSLHGSVSKQEFASMLGLLHKVGAALAALPRDRGPLRKKPALTSRVTRNRVKSAHALKLLGGAPYART